MSDATSLQRLRRVERPAAPSALSNALVFGWRAVLKFKHVPEQLFDLVMTPIMFTLLFTFVFGGALAGSPSEYLQFFLPAISPAKGASDQMGSERKRSNRPLPRSVDSPMPE